MPGTTLTRVLPFRLWSALALLALAAPLSAAQGPLIPGQWHNLGPDGGFVETLAVHPTNPLVVYAGGWGGVFRSVDGGASWVAANHGLSGGGLVSTAVAVNSLAVDRMNPATVYAGLAGDGLARSTDGGGSWTHIDSGLPSRAVAAVAVDPSSPKRLFAATFGGLYRSVNSGVTWQRLTGGLPPSLINAVTVVTAPKPPNTVYAVFRGPTGQTSQAFKSTNGGTSWSSISSGLTSHVVFKLAIAPSSASTLYAGAASGVLKSTDGGASWKVTTLGAVFVSDLVIHPALAGTVYAGSAAGVFRTTDGGLHWSRMGEGLSATAVRSLALIPSSPKVLYAGTYYRGADGGPGGVFKSRNAAQSWRFSSHGMSALSVTAFAVDPQNPSVLWLSNTVGLFKSVDRGATWVKIEHQPTCSGSVPNLPPAAIAVDPVDSDTAYLVIQSSFSRVCRTQDGGATWESVLRTESPLDGIWIDPHTPSTLFAAGRGIWRSTDHGTTWSPLGGEPDQLDRERLFLSPASLETWYVAGSRPGPGIQNALLRTTDGGGTWSSLPLRSDIQSLTLDPTDAATLYMTATGEVFKSLDGGATWSSVSSAFFGRRTAVTIDPAAPETLYLSVYTQNVYESTDDGVTWRPLGDGPDHVLFYSLAVAPQDPRRIYLGSGGGALIEFTKRP